MKTFKALCLIGTFLLAACAKPSDEISAQYVSPIQYQNLTCKQIRSEMQVISRRVHETAGTQDKIASNDGAAMGVGLILFWPALFFINSDDKAAELGRLKGEYQSLEDTAIQKSCDVAKEIEEARKLADQRRLEKVQQQKSRERFN